MHQPDTHSSPPTINSDIVHSYIKRFGSNKLVFLFILCELTWVCASSHYESSCIDQSNSSPLFPGMSHVFRRQHGEWIYLHEIVLLLKIKKKKQSRNRLKAIIVKGDFPDIART